MSRGEVVAVIGAQYGSEGKGAIVSKIANRYQVHIRVGSPNAGHTIYWKGVRHVMQSIPCGWINPEAKIVIGRGALLNMEIMMQELEHIEKFYPDFRSRLYIDSKAGVLDEKFHKQEGGVDGEMHKRIGSTGEGVGPARMARLARDPEQFYLFESIAKKYGLGGCMYDNTPALIAKWNDAGMNVLLEGTQGSGLSLLHSHWPYCTSIDTNAAAILSECGIAPERLSGVILIARTYPIRVAGNSGPLRNEITWEEVSRRTGKEISERTTVTKKIRRVAEWDDEVVENAIALNGESSWVALTFADYIDPAIYGKNGTLNWADPSLKKVREFCLLHGIKNRVIMVSTGPDSVIEVR